MSDRKNCIRCNRAIDAWARICPFCNQDQSEPVPAVAATPPAEVTAYTPPEEFGLKRKLAMAGAGILLLFVSFGIGLLINSDDTPKNAPVPIAEKPVDDDVVRNGKRADTQLIPMNEPLAQPITSAPAAAPDANVPNEYQRHDATAVSSVEYQQLAARAQAEKQAAAGSVDPRSLTGRAYAQAPRPRRTLAVAASAPSVPSTHPVAEYQPLPHIRVSQPTNVHVDLTVGADGRIGDITLRGVVPGHTAEILSAIRQWRYKPATVNGNAVPAPVSVDISFKGNE